jgi:hypothetical protein
MTVRDIACDIVVLVISISIWYSVLVTMGTK